MLDFALDFVPNETRNTGFLSGALNLVGETANSLLGVYSNVQNVKLSGEKLKTDAKIASAQLDVQRAAAEAGADLAKVKAAQASQLAIEQTRAQGAAAIAAQQAGAFGARGFSTVEILGGIAAALTIYSFFKRGQT